MTRTKPQQPQPTADRVPSAQAAGADQCGEEVASLSKPTAAPAVDPEADGRLYWHSPDASLYLGDCLHVLPFIADASVDLVLSDPPYFRVVDEEWDRQWKTDDDYLAWIGRLCEQWRRVLAPNGSLYCFASPRMAARVEVEIGKWFNVLNRITWAKPEFGTKAEMNPKEWQRCYFPVSEAIIFAEQHGADADYHGAIVAENADFFTACETAKRGIFGDYLREEFARAGVTNRQIAALFPSATGGLTGCVSNWLLGYNCPTPEQYRAMRDLLNTRNCQRDYLRREYEDLRREYEDLRREYEDLRRPFSVSADVPYTDVWDFPTVGAYPGKHPCEKPPAMMEHIVAASSRPGALVLDSFSGSGVVSEACRRLGRRCIAIEADPEWVKRIRRRLDGLVPLPMAPKAARRDSRRRLYEPEMPLFD